MGLHLSCALRLLALCLWYLSSGGGGVTIEPGASPPPHTHQITFHYLKNVYRWRALANITHNIPATGSRLTTANNNGGVATLTGHNTIRGRAMRAARTFRWFVAKFIDDGGPLTILHVQNLSVSLKNGRHTRNTFALTSLSGLSARWRHWWRSDWSAGRPVSKISSVPTGGANWMTAN